MIDTNVQSPTAPFTPEEDKRLIPVSQQWSNDYALKVSTTGFQVMETYRQQNHDRRFQNSDQLFVAWQPQKVWEGTRIPRSSLGVFLTMQQEETLLDNVMAALFPLEDNVIPEPMFGTSVAQARLSLQLILQQLKYSAEGYANIRESVRLALKQAILYGNGILEVSWLYREIMRMVAIPVWDDPTYQAMYSSIAGELPKRHLVSQAMKQIINQPLVTHVDIRSFYIDPNTSSPDVQKARDCAVRTLLTKEDLAQYRGMPNFDVPSDLGLDILSQNKTATSGDQAIQVGKSYNGISYQPTQDYTGNPNDKRVELIRYYSNNRVVWMLNRRWVMYNQPNELGVKPFLNAFYIDVPNSFYGLSMADVCEPEQRLQQSLINARIDELALSIHSPFVKKRGDNLPQNSLRMVPGRVIELDYPAEFTKLEWKNVTQDAAYEVGASEQRNQKTTGLTDTASFGVGSAGGNSANRTATGVNSQVAAAGKRINGIINNIESNFIEPLFNLLHQYNKTFLNPSQVFYLTGVPQGVDPRSVIHANVCFKAIAGRKLQSRMMVLQTVPQMLPVLLNPAFAEQMRMQGWMLNPKAVMDDIADAIGLKETQWFQPVTEEQMQFMQANDPNQLRAQTTMQMARERLAAQAENQVRGDDTKLLAAVMPVIAKNEGLQRAATGFKAKEEKPNASRTQ